jgi:hypothetical protein
VTRQHEPIEYGTDVIHRVCRTCGLDWPCPTAQAGVVTRSVEIPDEAVEAASKALIDEGGAPGNSIHSWRCEYPDRYGECDCVEVTARAALVAARPYLMPTREQIAHCLDAPAFKKDGYYETAGARRRRDYALEKAAAVMALLSTSGAAENDEAP